MKLWDWTVNGSRLEALPSARNMYQAAGGLVLAVVK
jgi:hypothetical protein